VHGDVHAPRTKRIAKDQGSSNVNIFILYLLAQFQVRIIRSRIMP
jgi:hypothetical protein